MTSFRYQIVYTCPNTGELKIHVETNEGECAVLLCICKRNHDKDLNFRVLEYGREVYPAENTT